MRILLILSLLLVTSSVRAEDAPKATLAERLTKLMDGPDYPQAAWGVLVVNAKTGETVFERHADRLFTPASVTKLYSCAAAMIALGADSTIETPVYRRGELTDGKLKGDLILVAKGDLTMGGRTTADGKVAFVDNDHIYANYTTGEAKTTNTNPLAGLERLAKHVRDAGIKQVTGEIIVDDRLFDRASGSGSGPDVISPILVNDNLVDVLITSGDKPGEPTKVKLVPETAFLQADVDVVTGSDTGVTITLDAITPNHFRIRGSVPADGKTRLRILPIDDPTAFARGLFIEALRRAGVRVAAAVQKSGRIELPPRGDTTGYTQVASITSPKLSEVLKVTLKVSHNLYASTLPGLIAASKGQRTVRDGLREQGKILKDLGVDVSTISFGGGAGGHWADCVTPRATVALVQALRKRPDWPLYRDALPSLGVDGTLAEVVPKDSPARGHVFAKTGTLTYDDTINGRTLLRSKAFAGAMTTAKGTELSLAMFVNNVPLAKGVGSSREGKMLGKLAETIYVHGP
jgi:serine-type D-Ala-D-Ala carboxypeptidase/endopeptidase (penicillin-binding protein 4)